MNERLCDFNVLSELLHGKLNAKCEQNLEQHLLTCEECAEELERLAAPPARWNEAGQLLKDAPRRQVPQADECGDESVLPTTVRQVVRLLQPTDDPNSMGRMGGYEVLAVVGSGATGVVLKAKDASLNRIVALKVLKVSLAECGTARKRFELEAKAAAGVLHPNIISIHYVSTDQELPYIVMPYIKGASLQQHVNREGPLPLSEVLRIGSQIAAGLAAAHRQGVIHRDIKPANIMLDFGMSTAFVTDFGLARTVDDATMTRSGAITGTPEYMSPEQARGETVGFASDIFSLGSLLYTLCTGRPPFRSKTPYGVLRKISDETPRPIRELNPAIPKWFSTIIEQMHRKDPSNRPTAERVYETLEKCLAHVHQPDSMPLPHHLNKSVNKSLFLIPRYLLPNHVLGGALVMTLITIAAIVFWINPWENPNEIIPKESQSNASNSVVDEKVFKTIRMKFPDQDRPGNLVIDINRGFIEVESHASEEVIIEVLYPDDFKSAKEGGKQTQSYFAPQYDLKKVPADNRIDLDTYNQNYVLNLRVKVPEHCNVSLDSYYDGYISVDGVSGSVKASSEHGDIRLTKIAGQASARSRNGSIRVELLEVDPKASLDFESYNGSIELKLPTDINATVAVYAGAGHYDSSLPLQEVSESIKKLLPVALRELSDDYQIRKIKDGGIPIRIESEKGAIRIGSVESEDQKD